MSVHLYLRCRIVLSYFNIGVAFRFINLNNLLLIVLTKRVVRPLERRSTVTPKKLVQFG